ncbi:MAG TPA: hypothetical protein VI011_06375 [Asanoa sp.]
MLTKHRQIGLSRGIRPLVYAAMTAARPRRRRRFCALDDGHAAQRVVRRVFLGEA